MSDISSPEQTAIRYKPKDLFPSPEAVIEHFQPDAWGKDRFGNRFFSSRDLAYTDRSDQHSVKAGLLVSPAGENFIKTNPHILRDISRGLATATGDSFAGYPKDFVEISPGRKIKHLNSGGQSAVFIMETGESKYLVKIKKGVAPGFVDVTQPYTNEMLQVQSLAADLEPNLKELGVRLPDYLFASPVVAVRKYEEGEESTEVEINEKFRQLNELVRNYISDQRSNGNSLWKHILVDMRSPLGDLRTQNFIRNHQGELVWIDPVYYSSKKDTGILTFTKSMV